MNCLYLEASVVPAAAAAAVVIVVVVVVAAAVVVAVAVAVAAAVVADYLQRRVRCLDSLRFQPFFTRIYLLPAKVLLIRTMAFLCLMLLSKAASLCCVASRPAIR